MRMSFSAGRYGRSSVDGGATTEQRAEAAMNYRITLVQSEEGWAVWCDDLPGCCSQGTTREEAVDNIRGAIRECLDAQPAIEMQFGTRILHEEITV
jgi:predicted RNase H-like HicB family nuclease